jgi:hypothetical protein
MITIQVTKTTPCGHTDVVFERECETRAGARRSLIAAIERETRAWGSQDDVSWSVAEGEAARWMATSDFNELVRPWNATPGGLRFAALVR